MKKDRKLQKYAKERLSALGDEEFLFKLKQKVPVRQKISKKKRNLIAALTGTLTAAVIAVVAVICVAFGDFQDDAYDGRNNDFLYIAGKADFGMSTLQELNGETTVVDLFVRSTDNLDVTRYFDIETDKTKYYVVNFSSEVMEEKATVCVVMNGYEYGGAIASAAMTNYIDFGKFTVRYNYSYYPDNGRYMYQYQGIIDTGEEKIYIWYNAARQSVYDGFYAFAATMFC